MNNKITLTRDRLVDLATRIRKATAGAGESRDALIDVSRLLTSELGDYFGPEILSFPDELSISFVELLDQIIFETEENTPSENAVGNYIFSDLQLRLNKYLDILQDKELYKQNLAQSVFTHDDTVIIRYFCMKEFIPELIAEYTDHPSLKKSILRCLLGFTTEDLITFYYRIVKEDSCMEAKILALVGLKLSSQKFNNWKHLYNGDQRFNAVTEYAKNFDTELVQVNRVSDEPLSLIFSVFFIEQAMKDHKEKEFINWTVEVLKKITSLTIDPSLQAGLYTSIGNILIFCKPESMAEILKDAALLQSFILLLDMLPPETFRRVTMALSRQGNAFTESANKLINEGKVKPKEGESNILGYLLWGKEAALI